MSTVRYRRPVTDVDPVEQGGVLSSIPDFSKITALVICAIVTLGYLASYEARFARLESFNILEQRIDRAENRYDTLEKMMLPLLIDYNTRKRVIEEGTEENESTIRNEVERSIIGQLRKR